MELLGTPGLYCTRTLLIGGSPLSGERPSVPSAPKGAPWITQRDAAMAHACGRER